MLAARLHVRPADVPLRIDAHGRPHVASPRLDISISHSADIVAVAVAERAVGIDIEALKPLDGVQQLFALYAAPSERNSGVGGEHAAAFYTLWTRKEALLKASSRDLRSADLQTIDVTADDVCDATGRWSLMSLAVLPGFACAIAVQHERDMRNP